MKQENAPLQAKILKKEWKKLPTDFSWQGPESGKSVSTPLNHDSSITFTSYTKEPIQGEGKKEYSEKDAV